MASNKSNPFIELLEKFATVGEKIVENTHNTFSVLRSHCDQSLYEPHTFEAFPESPTAQKYLEAYDKCIEACFIILQYKKENVENDEDCEYLSPAFHCYSQAHMCQNHMFNMRSPSDKAVRLLGSYLKLRPNDVLAKYLHILILMLEPNRSKTDKRSEFKMLKNIIIAAEKFAFETERIDDVDLKKDILTDLYFNLGSIYSVTHQKCRALDSFQKSWKYKKGNYLALFGIAYSYQYNEPDKAVSFFKQYIEEAPKCDKQYNEAYYSLAVIELVNYKNLNAALQYAALGDDIYAKQLPFLEKYETPSKHMMDTARIVLQLSNKQIL